MNRSLAIARWGAGAVLVPCGLAFGDEKLNDLKPFLKQNCFERSTCSLELATLFLVKELEWE